MKDFENIIGYESVKKELRQISDVLKNKEIYDAIGARAPKGLLLYGEPGVGKSLMATSLIEAIGRKAFVCRKNKPDGEFVDEIKRVFDEAVAAAPSIVFLDDMDKFANGDDRHPDAEEYVTVQSCIDEVKDKEVFVVATANRLSALPESLLRTGRFDRTIKIHAPKGNDAVKIIEYYLGNKKIASELDVNEIVKILNGRTCSDLETVVNDAGIFAGFERSDIVKKEHFIKACLHTLFRISLSDLMKAELNADLNDLNDHLTTIIYHEAGHATIVEVLHPGNVGMVSAYSRFGEDGGFVLTQSDILSSDDVRKEIVIGLGGRAATEQKFGILDIGVKSDIDGAYNLCNSLIGEDCTCGFSFHNDGWEDSEAIKARRETMVLHELDRYYAKAKEIIAANTELFEAIAHALAKKGILTFEDIQKIKEECRIVHIAV